MKAEENSKSTFMGQFVYSINDIKYEWVDAIDFEDAISKLHSKSDWNNDRYDLNVFCSEYYHQSQLQALKKEVEELDVFGVKDGSEWHDVVRLDKIRNLITNLEDK